MKKLILTLFAVTALVAVSCGQNGPEGQTPAAGTSKTINGIETVYIPAGTFLMGSPETEPNRNDDELQHSVTLTKGFYMGKYEITNAQYCKFLNEIKDDLKIIAGNWFEIEMTIDGSSEVIVALNCFGEKGVQFDAAKEEFYLDKGYENHPMRYVTWFGASEFAKWAGGRLPTEAQWEYACRGGQKSSFPFGIGDRTKLIKGMASFNYKYSYDLEKGGAYEDETAEYDDPVAVGSYTANAWGLYDMHGNVEEWCADWYGEDYYSDNQTDPTGPESGKQNVNRGGSYYDSAKHCRSAYRNASSPGTKDSCVGFRVIFPEQ